ncbi:MAG: hypothetical protein ACFFD2_00830 [Promethearchaeota archaeon]
MRLNFKNVLLKLEKYSIFLLISFVFSTLFIFFELFLVESTSYDPIFINFFNLFVTSGFLICLIPFILGYMLIISYLIAKILKNFSKKDNISEILSKILSNKLLLIAFTLISISILLLFAIFPLGNPHKFLIPEEENYIILYPGHNWWMWIPDCECTYTLEIINFKIYWGFIFGILIPIFVLFEVLSNKLVLRHYYNIYLPEYS